MTKRRIFLVSSTLPVTLFLISQSALGQDAPAEVTVEIDWLAEVFKGGLTSVALAVLLMAGITFAVERLLASRRKFVAPRGLAEEVAPLWARGDFTGITLACEEKPSTLGRMIEFLVHHRDTDPGLLIPSAQDIASREMQHHSQKTYSLAVVAALAPLLGLLGTMIGMIESFKLVEVYGDDGGASMLAGSISKALITTTVGLIIAIGALAVYHGLKSRLNAVTSDLEEEFERLVNRWLLRSSETSGE
jgi:biopolymer transport protein ExbB